MSGESIPIRKINDNTWEIPKTYKECMTVPGILYADEELLQKVKQDLTLEQLANVACLPGVLKHAVAMPDAHQGYGFPIGGVAATDYAEGVISPGGVGYDINCGVRILASNLTVDDVKPKINELIDLLFREIPSGLASKGKIRVNVGELNEVISGGAKWAVEKGYGWSGDLKHCEEDGCMRTADPDEISPKAKDRGKSQIGSLGSGNHFLEVQFVDKIFQPDVARRFGIEATGQVLVMIHTGSRGLGHETCSDYLRLMESSTRKFNIKLPDRELACAPNNSMEAEKYFKAMSGAANFAWCNRQLITHWTREAFKQVFRRDAEELGMRLIYDVAHNIAKLEEHDIDGKRVKCYVHRKGATRAFPADHPDLPADYRDIGQPVIIPGTMGTSSYLLLGKPKAMGISFGSTAHGAGRVLSRMRAIKSFSAADVKSKLTSRNIVVRAADLKVISEEAPGAYKDIDRVVKVSNELGIATLVAQMRPLAVTKG